MSVNRQYIGELAERIKIQEIQLEELKQEFEHFKDKLNQMGVFD